MAHGIEREFSMNFPRSVCNSLGLHFVVGAAFFPKMHLLMQWDETIKLVEKNDPKCTDIDLRFIGITDAQCKRLAEVRSDFFVLLIPRVLSYK